MESAKLMKLYDRVDRIHHELRALGIADDATLDVRQLAQFDQYHYHGTDAVDLAAARLGLDATSHVLDVGAGIGGPARWLAATTGCRVDGDRAAARPERDRRRPDPPQPARRSRHARRGQHPRRGAGAGAYDALISYLVFLHIPDRARLFAACHRALRPGAGMYIEDFTLLSEPTAEQREALRVKVQCPYVPSPEVYRQDIAGAGFASVDFEDVTQDWTAFTAERAAAFRTVATVRCASTAPVAAEGLARTLQRWPACMPTASWAARILAPAHGGASSGPAANCARSRFRALEADRESCSSYAAAASRKRRNASSSPPTYRPMTPSQPEQSAKAQAPPRRTSEQAEASEPVVAFVLATEQPGACRPTAPRRSFPCTRGGRGDLQLLRSSHLVER